MKNLLFVCAALFMGLNLNAQVNSLGPTAGFNYAWMSDRAGSTGRPAWNAGLTYTYSIFQKVGIGVDAKYSVEGMKLEQNNVKYLTDLRYIRLPFKVIYFFNELPDNFRPKLYVGPTLGFLIGGKTDAVTETGKVTVDSKDLIENFDFGATVGAGFNYRLAEMTWLNFDVAYTHGFVDVVKSGAKSSNRNVNVNLGVAWGF